MKTINTSALVLTLSLGVFSFNAVADDLIDPNNQAPLAGEFKKLDTNSNDLLTFSEASKDKLFTKKRFAAADLDKDGTLDQNEYSTYKSSAQKKVVKTVVSDSVITTKAKAEILGAKDLKSLQISVETHKGEVILSGFVDSAAAKAKAEEVVSKIEGVTSVKNSLEVRS
ncbi:MAG: BON domain-containing protein [Methylophilaceae bacterium]|nr:BON domain-containing protein [Methylophilaceae bacterium]